jgi:hypothetical protein
MKTNRTLFLFSVLIFLFSITVKAQLPYINSLLISPANPTNEDTVKVTCESSFPSGGCPMISSSVIPNGYTIEVYAMHSLGPLTYICNSTNTITVGKLSVGSYVLNYNLGCVPCLPQGVTASVPFTVTAYTGISGKESSVKGFDLFPNPAEHNITLQLPPRLSASEILVCDIYGKQLIRFENISPQNKIDVSILPAGVYMVAVRSGNEMFRTKFVKH